jgi:4-oxalomesaconate hydratase
MLERAIDIFRELNPSFVLSHALKDPYNVDHPEAAHFAQQARVIAQAMGHKPAGRLHLFRPGHVPVRAAPARAMRLQAGCAS